MAYRHLLSFEQMKAEAATSPDHTSRQAVGGKTIDIICDCTGVRAMADGKPIKAAQAREMLQNHAASVWRHEHGHKAAAGRGWIDPMFSGAI